MNHITTEIAELAGIFAADGCMQKDYICLWGNISEDREYYDMVIKRLFNVAFGIDVRPHEKRSNSVYGFYVCKRDILNFFTQHLGFHAGSKTNTVCVPPSILQSRDRQIWAAFVRGVADGDGCLTFDKRYGTSKKVRKIVHNYPRIQIRSVAYELINGTSMLLDKLGIIHFVILTKNHKPNEQDSYLLQVSGVERLHQWMKVVGFSNPAKLTKYCLFNRYGFVPPNTTISQRKAMLDNELSPVDFYPSEFHQEISEFAHSHNIYNQTNAQPSLGPVAQLG